jgi:hypothetical protein
VQLAYGDPFSIMANFPFTTGLGYSVGNMIVMGWIRAENLLIIRDSNIGGITGGANAAEDSGLNIQLKLYRHDTGLRPAQEIMGIQVGLKGNNYDIIISYKASVADKQQGTIGYDSRGVYVQYQARDYSDAVTVGSILLDATCFSVSQVDAVVHADFTFMDTQEQIVFEVGDISIDKEYVPIHIYKAPSNSADLASIRGRARFTDGFFKCPNSCVDTDYIIESAFAVRGCPDLANSGSCNTEVSYAGEIFQVDTEV